VDPDSYAGSNWNKCVVVMPVSPITPLPMPVTVAVMVPVVIVPIVVGAIFVAISVPIMMFVIPVVIIVRTRGECAPNDGSNQADTQQ
jgi:hypothetical protein